MRMAVVGGGVVGLSSALRLCRAGIDVIVFERDDGLAAASWNNAGHIATEQVAPLASVATLRSAPGRLFARGGALGLPPKAIGTWLPFALRLMVASRPATFAAGRVALGALLAQAMPAWTRLAGALGEPHLVREAGHLVVWETARSAALGRAAWAAADIGTAVIAEPSPADARLLAGLSPTAGAIRFTGTGQVSDLGRLARALREAIVASGGAIVAERGSVARSGDRASIDGHSVDAVMIAAGIDSAAPMAALGHRVPMIAERGYHIRARADRWPADAPPVVFEDRAMIVTRYDDVVQAASFVEFAGRDAPPDPRKWNRLEAHVHALGLPIQAPFARWMGARPTLPDYLPAIGRSRKADNLFYAFGHQHLGLTLAAVTAEAIVALVTGEAPAIDLGAFDIARFERSAK